MPPRPVEAPLSTAATPLPAVSAPAIPSAPTAPVPAASAAPSPEPTPAFAEKTESLRNNDVDLRLTNRGGGIQEAVLLKNMAEHGDPVVINQDSAVPIGVIINDPKSAALSEFSLLKEADNSVRAERSEQGLSIRKRFFFTHLEAKDNYILEMDVDFRNDGTQPYQRPNYFVTLGSAQPIHAGDWSTYTRMAWSIDGKMKSQNVEWFGGGSGFLGLGARGAQTVFEQPLTNAQWVAVTNQFFTTLFAPLDDKPIKAWAERFEVKREGQPPNRPLYAITGAMQMPGFELAPGQSKTVRIQIYVGPKIYHRLAKLEHDEAGVVDFGVFLGLGFIKLVSQFLLNLLNLIHGVVRDYGFSILILTLLVKGVLWPIQNKANYSMRRMALLSPKMQALREKYQQDPTKMNQEVMKLYKEYGVNPMSGCLPMFIQIPIFFGLFSMLQQAVELRDATFLWVKDLSQPDTLAHVPGFGWPINALPLMMAATNVWLVRMTPKTGDPTQRRMMMLMPLVFVIFCYNFAAALALYYTAQNLLTILQLHINQKQPPPTLEKVALTQKHARK